MSNPVLIQKERSEMSDSSWRALKAFGFIIVMAGPGIPFTVLLWKMAVGG